MSKRCERGGCSSRPGMNLEEVGTLSFAASASAVSKKARGSRVPLPVPSEEQEIIIAALRDGTCVHISAFAGTGKTTTCLLAAQTLGVDTVLITYNKNLKEDTQVKVLYHGLEDTVRVFTFHGFFRTMMKAHETDHSVPKIKDDETLSCALKLWRRGEHLPIRVDADMVNIDELQDLCPFYYECIEYVLPTKPVLMLTVGDAKQTLYDFKGGELKANPMYIKETPHYFSRYTGNREWAHCRLTISYRLTPNVTRFVNEVWCTDIVAGNTRSPNLPVEYWHVNLFDTETLGKRIQRVFNQEEAWNVYLLCQSTKKGANSQTPIEKLINHLGQVKDENGDHRFNFHVVDNEDGDKCVTVEALKNKTRVWTFCASKGTAAPVVIVFGFHAYDREKAQSQINQMGVALSRSSKRLIVIHGKSSMNSRTGYWPGMCRDKILKLIEDGVVVLHKDDIIPSDNEVGVEICKKSLTPTGLMHMSPDSLERLLKPFASVESTIIEDARAVNMALSGEFSTGALPTTENFSFLYGCAIPFALEHRTTGRISMIERILNLIPLQIVKNYDCGTIERFLRARNMTSQTVDGVLTLLFRSGPKPRPKPLPYLKGNKILEALRQVQLKDQLGRAVCFCDSNAYDTLFGPHIEKIRSVYDNLKRTSLPGDFVFLANASHAFGHSHHLWMQIGSKYEAYHNWVDEVAFRNGLRNLECMTGVLGTFESDVTRSISPTVVKGGDEYIDFYARVDNIGKDDRVYEFKFKDEITGADRVQALLGTALVALEKKSDRKACLLNYKTGEMWEAPVSLDTASMFVSRVETEVSLS